MEWDSNFAKSVILFLSFLQIHKIHYYNCPKFRPVHCQAHGGARNYRMKRKRHAKNDRSECGFVIEFDVVHMDVMDVPICAGVRWLHAMRVLVPQRESNIPTQQK